jgi:tetratricopeptide (TPR) repeat protein
LVFALRGQHGKAVDQFDECLNKVQDVNGLNARARSLIVLNEMTRAVADIETALRLQNGFAPALVTRARTRLKDLTADRDASLNAALQDLNEAMQHSPGLVEAHVERARVMKLMGNGLEAIESYGRALELVRFDVALLRERARLLAETGQKREALEDYSALIRAGKASPDDLRRSGDCHADLKQWADAIADYSDALQNAPQDYALLLRRARCHAALGNKPDALADCQRLLELAPADSAVLELKRNLESN